MFFNVKCHELRNDEKGMTSFKTVTVNQQEPLTKPDSIARGQGKMHLSLMGFSNETESDHRSFSLSKTKIIVIGYFSVVSNDLSWYASTSV